MHFRVAVNFSYNDLEIRLHSAPESQRLIASKLATLIFVIGVFFLRTGCVENFDPIDKIDIVQKAINWETILTGEITC